MSLFLVTAPSVEPISLNEAKLHLKVDTTADDSLIEGAIRTAREYAETFTHRAFVQQTWDDKRDCPPGQDEAIVVPFPPTQSITSITYLDTAGDSQTWSSAEYLTDLPAGPQAQKARITPAYGFSYPQTYPVMNAFTVRFVAGYAGSAKTVSSITRSSSTATVTTAAAHGFSTYQRITIAGADQAAYNGTFEITVTGAATFTFTVTGSPASPATGSITAANLGIPAPITAAMLLLIGRMYEKRVAAVIEGEVTVADQLLWPYKAF